MSPAPDGASWYLVDTVPQAGPFVLDGPEGRHAQAVRRSRVGEQIVLTDGRGTLATATVTALGRQQVSVQVTDRTVVARPAQRVTVVQALPKGERGDLAVELLTEAGADAIVPWQAQRCVARWTGERAGRGVAKWRTVAREAAKQSRRPWVPEIADLAGTPAVAALVTAADRALILHESAADRLPRVSLPGEGTIVLVVGPEGGVAPGELTDLSAAGARPVRLGPQVLRSSSAGAVALGALGVLTARWS